MRRWLLIIGLFILLLVWGGYRYFSVPVSQPTVGPGQTLLYVDDPSLDELSGLSWGRGGTLWGLNDSGSEPLLFAIDAHSGQVTHRLMLLGAKNNDWEDAANAQFGGRPHLLIADTGDNHARRDHVNLYLLPEPEPGSLAANPRLPITAQLQFQYEDGARDVEAVAVDNRAAQIYLLSKRDWPPRLYQLPMSAFTQEGMHTARLVAEVQGIPLPSAAAIEADPYLGPKRSRPTAMAISADGSTLVITTYQDSYVYRQAVEKSRGWADIVRGSAQALGLPRLTQTEAGTFVDGQAQQWVIGSEQAPAQLLKVTLP